jgi:Ca2+-binding EF-hand superfamily protein
MTEPHDVRKERVLKHIRTDAARRGIEGLGAIHRVFKRADFDGSGRLSEEELDDCLKMCGVFLSKDELHLLLSEADKNQDGSVSYDELLTVLKGPMSDRALAMVDKCFRVMDRDGSGVVTTADVTSVYSASQHPLVVQGKITEEQVLKSFVESFEGSCGDSDGRVTLEEWRSYYEDIAAGVPSEQYFITMLEGVWMINEHDSDASRAQMQRIATLVRAKTLERTHGCETERHAMERAFRFYDKDRSGALGIDEFLAALASMGVSVERRDVRGVFDILDTDGAGTISYAEFADHVFGAEESAAASTSVL